MGAPKKPEALAKSARLNTTMSPGEHAEISAAGERAMARGEAGSVSDWVRQVLLAAARADAPKPPRKRTRG